MYFKFNTSRSIEPDEPISKWTGAHPSFQHCASLKWSKCDRSFVKHVGEIEKENYPFRSALGLPLLFPHRSATGPIPHVSSPSHSTLYRRTWCIESRADVKIEYWLACGLDSSRVVVNYIAYLFSAGRRPSSHVPIMAIERRFGPTRSASMFSIDLCTEHQLTRTSLERSTLEPA